ncbi:unnamed protein product [Coregonus sp. 'balchen']|nr:unnamed protein product [Coregonus sp. 'balchen']
MFHCTTDRQTDIMIRVLLTATVSLLWLTGSCVSLSVHQSPLQLTKRPGNTLKITCSHHDRNYDKIYWYRQTHGQQLQIIGFLSFKEAFDVAENFNISGDAENEGFLGSPAVRVEDTGVYYCAVSKAQNQGGPEELQCSHRTPALDRLYWDQQTAGGGTQNHRTPALDRLYWDQQTAGGGTQNPSPRPALLGRADRRRRNTEPQP